MTCPTIQKFAAWLRPGYDRIVQLEHIVRHMPQSIPSEDAQNAHPVKLPEELRDFVQVPGTLRVPLIHCVAFASSYARSARAASALRFPALYCNEWLFAKCCSTTSHLANASATSPDTTLMLDSNSLMEVCPSLRSQHSAKSAPAACHWLLFPQALIAELKAILAMERGGSKF